MSRDLEPLDISYGDESGLTFLELALDCLPDGKHHVLYPCSAEGDGGGDAIYIEVKRPRSKEIAEQVKASWNACADVPTDQLQPGMVARLIAENAALKVAFRKLYAEAGNDIDSDIPAHEDESGQWPCLWCGQTLDMDSIFCYRDDCPMASLRTKYNPEAEP